MTCIQGTYTSKKYTIQRFPTEVIKRLDDLKVQMHAKSRPEVLEKLLELHGQAESPAVGQSASFQVVFPGDDKLAPVCINGPPASGKSYATEHLIMDCIARSFPVLVADVNDNQPWIRDSMKSSELSGFAWPEEGCYGISFPHDSRYRFQDMARVVEDFNRAFSEGKALDYVIVIEDALEFAHARWFREFVALARKHCRALIIVSQDFMPFRALCRPFSPLPRQETPE